MSRLGLGSRHRSHEHTYALLTDLTMRSAFAALPCPVSLSVAFPLSYHYLLRNPYVLLT